MLHFLQSLRCCLLLVLLLFIAVSTTVLADDTDTDESVDPFGEISGFPALQFSQGVSQISGVVATIVGGFGFLVIQACFEENGIAGIVICPFGFLQLALGSVVQSVVGSDTDGIENSLNFR